MIIKRIVSALLLLTMLLSMVSGCVDDNGAGDVDYVYVTESIPFPILPRGLPHSGIKSRIMFYGDTVFFIAVINNPFDYYGVDDPLEFDFTWYINGSIFSMNPDGTNLQELPDYYFEPPPHEPGSVERVLGGVYLNSFAIDHDGSLWVFETKDFLDDVGNYIETYYVRKLSSTGAELLSLDVTAFVPGIVNRIHPSFCVDKDGYVYFLFERSVIVINSTGASSFCLDVGAHYAKRIILLPDGNVAHHDGNRKIRVIDAMSQAWGEEIELPAGASDAVAGNDEIPILFLIESRLMGINAETGEVVEFVNFTDRDVIFDHLINLAFLSDGQIIAVTYSMSGGRQVPTQYELIQLLKIPAHENQERTELTLFGYEIDSIVKNAVVEFNQTSKTYRIQMTDYAAFNQREGDDTGLKKLSTELIAGNVPDILALSNLPFRQYADKGLLVDLNGFFDDDPGIDRADYFENIMRAAQTGDALYRVFPAFVISSLIGNPEVLGSSPVWTLNEFKAVLNANPKADIPLGEWMTKTRFLNLTFSHNIEQFVDWDSGTVHFDSEEFIELLKLSDSFPLESDDNRPYPTTMYAEETIVTGRQITEWGQLVRFTDYMIDRTYFGGGITFKGFPGDKRKGSMLSISGDVAITAQSKHKQGAWEFVRLLLSEDFVRDNVNESYIGLPVHSLIFEEQIAYAMSYPLVLDSAFTGLSLDIPALSMEEAGQIRALIDSIDGILDRDEMLWNIISESASDFFREQITASDAAMVIQSRASIYMSEQR